MARCCHSLGLVTMFIANCYILESSLSSLSPPSYIHRHSAMWVESTLLLTLWHVITKLSLAEYMFNDGKRGLGRTVRVTVLNWN